MASRRAWFQFPVEPYKETVFSRLAGAESYEQPTKVVARLLVIVWKRNLEFWNRIEYSRILDQVIAIIFGHSYY